MVGKDIIFIRIKKIFVKISLTYYIWNICLHEYILKYHAGGDDGLISDHDRRPSMAIGGGRSIRVLRLSIQKSSL